MYIVNVPIESLEERYSAQWNQWFADYFKSVDDEYCTIIMPTSLRPTIQDGAFLDVIGTTKFKVDQISEICTKVDSGQIPRHRKVVFLVQDGWFPIEQLAYLRDMLGCHQWKFIGIFHDGTYDKWDLTARNRMYTWGEPLENSWFKIYDSVVVGSEYHKSVLLAERQIPESKIRVIPWCVKVPGKYVGIEKQKIVVFPHRLDMEKQPDVFRAVAEKFKTTHPDWQFICTKERFLSKDDYYELLSRSYIAVSCALLEMFGIAMVEATLLGCIPLVPDALAYREQYPDQFRYSDQADLERRLGEFMYDFRRGSSEYIFNWSMARARDVFRNSNNLFFDNLGQLIREI